MANDINEDFQSYKKRLEAVMGEGNLAWWEMELPSKKVCHAEPKAEILGYSPENFDHYEDFTELIHPEDYEDTKKAMENHIEGRKNKYEAEYRIKTKENGYKWVEDTGKITDRYSNGEPAKVTVLLIDINDRKRAKQEEKKWRKRLQKNVDQYKLILDSIKDPIIIYNLKGKILEFNKSASEFFEYSREELLSKSLNEIISSSNTEEINERIEKIKKHGHLVFETTDLTKNKEEVPVEVNSNLMDFRGEKAILSVVRNISNRKQFQRREFLYSLLRQDMNNKLQTSTGFLQLAKENIKNEELKLIQKAIKINKEGQNLIEILMKVHQSEKEPTKPINIVKLIKETCKEYQKLCEEKNIKINKKLDKIQTKALGGSSLKKILPKLIKTRIQKSNASKINLIGKEKPKKIVISIEDDGKTIPQPAKQKFSQQTYTGETSGIGGPIYFAAREIIKNYKGEIKFTTSNTNGEKIEIQLQKSKR